MTDDFEYRIFLRHSAKDKDIAWAPGSAGGLARNKKSGVAFRILHFP